MPPAFPTVMTITRENGDDNKEPSYCLTFKGRSNFSSPIVTILIPMTQLLPMV